MNDIDSTTGLPELPEGYFWRVFRNGGMFDIYPMVQIRERYKGMFGREKSRPAGIGDTLTTHSYGPRTGESVKENIIRLSESLYEEFQDQCSRAQEPDYSGDYPPKKFDRD